MMTLQEFEQLILQLKAGNPFALKPIFEHYGKACITHLANLGVERPLADDILVDAVLELKTKLLEGKIINPSGIKDDLAATCKKILFERHRPDVGSIDDLLYYFAKNALDETQLNAVLGNEKKHTALETKMQAYQMAFNSLGEKGKRILHLLYIERKTLSEAAAILGFDDEQALDKIRWKCLGRMIQNSRLHLKTLSRR